MLRYFEKKRERTAELKALQSHLSGMMHDMLGLAPDDIVKVGEIVCGAPGCADIETIFLIFREGCRTQALKIAAPMATLTQDMLQLAAARSALGWPASKD